MKSFVPLVLGEIAFSDVKESSLHPKKVIKWYSKEEDRELKSACEHSLVCAERGSLVFQAVSFCAAALLPMCLMATTES